MGDFDFIDQPVPARKNKAGFNPLIIISGLVVAIGIGLAGLWHFWRSPAKLTLDPVASQTVRENETLTLKLAAHGEGLPRKDWSFGIVNGPPGAGIDADTGVFSWKPAEDQGPGEFQVKVTARSKSSKLIHDTQSFAISVAEVNQAPVIAPIPTQKGVAGQEIRIPIEAKDADKPPQKLTFKLNAGPEGASVDRKTGVFSWSIPEEGVSGPQKVEVAVDDGSGDDSEYQTSFSIEVQPPTSALLRVVAAFKAEGLEVETTTGSAPDGFRGKASTFVVGDEVITFVEYESNSAARKDADQVTNEGQTVFGEPAVWKARTNLYRRDNLIVFFDGSSKRVAGSLEKILGAPFVVAEVSKIMPRQEKAAELTIDEKLVIALVKLYEKQNLTGKKDYPAVRKTFADFFEGQNELLLNRLSEGEGADFKKWLDNHADFKEEFYTAVTAEDDLAAAWKILQSLYQKHPTRLYDYGQLGIATALAWDVDKNLDHYDDHQRRTHSNMPGGMLGALENFQYFVETASVMQGRAQYLPWEFLIFMINQRTPLAEREWAIANYASRRTMYGKCYADVPYDHEMLRTQSRTCQLSGKDYTLPNIRQFGGVCAMQADFASRVGKSIGVPAEYVRGEAAGGELHAWVMWVEIKQVTRNSISFTLESHGRYREDKYYVGALSDPQNGLEITDRQLELRLQAVGLNPTAYRHAKLVMLAYPRLQEKLNLKPTQELALLNEVMELCPGNEAAWRRVAQLSRDGRIAADSNRQMTSMFDKLFRTFAGFPDFTWTVFDDLVQYQKNSKQRVKYYERLVQMYEAGGRPDLACEARLRLSDYLLEEGQTREVIDGLAFTIKKFPDEGRYVPKLLDKLERVCEGVKGADQQLLRFYQEFIPMVPQKRGNEPSPHCMRMLERAIAKFNSAGQPQQAQGLAVQLAALKKMSE